MRCPGSTPGNDSSSQPLSHDQVRPWHGAPAQFCFTLRRSSADSVRQLDRPVIGDEQQPRETAQSEAIGRRGEIDREKHRQSRERALAGLDRADRKPASSKIFRNPACVQRQ